MPKSPSATPSPRVLPPPPATPRCASLFRPSRRAAEWFPARRSRWWAASPGAPTLDLIPPFERQEERQRRGLSSNPSAVRSWPSPPAPVTGNRRRRPSPPTRDLPLHLLLPPFLLEQGGRRGRTETTTGEAIAAPSHDPRRCYIHCSGGCCSDCCCSIYLLRLLLLKPVKTREIR